MTGKWRERAQAIARTAREYQARIIVYSGMTLVLLGGVSQIALA